MKRQVLICGLVGGMLITVLKWTEYQFLVVAHSVEIYSGLIAATFAVLGIWLGIKLTGTRQRVLVEAVLLPLRSGLFQTKANERNSASRAVNLKSWN